MARLDLLLNSGAWMPSFMGRLRLEPAGARTSRLGSGVLHLLADHDPERPLGEITRIYVDGAGMLRADAETVETRSNRDTLEELESGKLRNGVSPGFLTTRARMVEPDDADYDARFPFSEIVQEYEIFEASSVTQPRDSLARVCPV